jgi:hypothetical protein
MQIKPIGNSLKEKKPIYLLKDIENFVKSFNYSTEEYDEKLNSLWINNDDIIIIENLILNIDNTVVKNPLKELETTINIYNDIVKSLDDIENDLNN